MAIEIFNRYENKYLLDENTLVRIQARLSDYMEPDEYNRGGETYSISNIYYDTAESDLIRASLSKPKYKEKLRLRAYGAVGSGSHTYVEIKKKFRGLVNKRRSALRLEEAYRFLQTGRLPEERPSMNMQVLREASYLLGQWDLKPALFLAYDRMAYFGEKQHDLRVSFDTNIRSRRTDLRFERGDYGQQLLGSGQWLMEIKVAQSIPVWLCRLLADQGVAPMSFSKYGAEYKNMLACRQNGSAPVFSPDAEWRGERLRTGASALAC